MIERRYDLVELLIDAGARVSRENLRGASPLALTATLGKRAGARMRQTLIDCAKRRDGTCK